jgi:SAM-dependent methyltransferase
LAASVSHSEYLVQAQERMTHARNYLAWQARLVTPELGRRVIEIGCGIGTFTRYLLDRDAVLALDIDPECIDRVKAAYAGRANLHAVVFDAGSDSLAPFVRFRPDSCVCLNVLEHIEDDAFALRSMYSVLEPGGVAVLLVPAFQALYGPVDRNLGHYRRYRAGSLARMAAAAGFRIDKMRYLNLAGFFAWWVSFRIFQRESHSIAQIGLFDRLIIPPLSRLESVIAPPFGQSLFAVLQKP